MIEENPVWQSKKNPNYTFDGKPTLNWLMPYMEEIEERHDLDDKSMFWEWVARINRDPDYSKQFVGIGWYATLVNHAKMEWCPYSPNNTSWRGTNWNDAYNQVGGKPLNWLTCQINHDNFITKVTGFKPSPLQPFVYLPTLVHAATSPKPNKTNQEFGRVDGRF